jgi:hypothetical protein
MRRSTLIALLVLAAGLVAAPAARAGTIINRAAAALQNDNVYVDPSAEAKISAADADRIRAEISSHHAGPMYVAILPAAAKGEAGGDVVGVARALAQALGREGNYAVAAGRSFAGGSTTTQGVAAAADDADQAHGPDGITAILLDFADRVGSLQSGGSGGSGGGGSGGGSSGTGLGVLALVAVGGGAFALSRRRRRRRQDDAEFAEVKENTRDDLVALGDDIRALDLDVQMPNLDPQAREAYAQAVDAYDRANTAWERARGPQDLEPVGAALEEGRWAMATAKARMEGRPAPERRPPCFFDPRHGPSSRDVEWAPYDGAPSMVPACEADAQRVERGDDPQAREVTVGGRSMPYWNAGPMYAPFAGGYFGGFGGGLFPGLMMGTLLGSAISGPMGWGGGWGDAGGWGGGYDGYDGGGGGDWGGGDFGGGGGGDFGGGGGGDFGGGDFGGGDFGGGDF